MSDELLLQLQKEIEDRKKIEGELRKSEKKFKTIFENANDVIAYNDKNGIILDVNERVKDIFGYTREEIIGKKFTDFDFLELEDMKYAQEKFMDILSGKPSQMIELKAFRKDKSVVYLEISSSVIKTQPYLDGILNIIRDITVRKQAVEELEKHKEKLNELVNLRTEELTLTNKQLQQEISERKSIEEALRESEEKYRLMAESTSDVIWIIDKNFKYAYMSPAVKQLRGYTPAEAMKQEIEEALTPQSVETVEALILEGLATGDGNPQNAKRTIISDLEMTCKDGSSVWTEVTMNFIKDRDGVNFMIHGVTHNISERKMFEEELAMIAYRDFLTGLYNRKAFMERFEESLNHAKRYNNEKAIFFIDLDNFKQVNDTYGHVIGDKLLMEVAKRLKQTSRESDHIFRLGGDEFTIILNNPEDTHPEILANRVVKKLSMPYRFDNIDIRFITTSIGVSIFPKDGEDIQSLIKSADMAMYQAKKEGDQYVCFDKQTN